MKFIRALALATCVPACATLPVAPSPAVLDAVARGEVAYLRMKPFALMLLPYVAPARAARAQLAMAAIEQAFATARLATAPADQAAALRDAEAGLAIVADLTGDTPVLVR